MIELRIMYFGAFLEASMGPRQAARALRAPRDELEGVAFNANDASPGDAMRSDWKSLRRSSQNVFKTSF